MITREKLKTFRTDFSEAVKDLEKKYGIKIEVGGITFSETDFHFKATCTELAENGKKKVDTRAFETDKFLLGFKGNIGDSYNYGGLTYTVEGLDYKKRKFPVLIKGSDGKSYKAPVDFVNKILAMEKAS